MLLFAHIKYFSRETLPVLFLPVMCLVQRAWEQDIGFHGLKLPLFMAVTTGKSREESLVVRVLCFTASFDELKIVYYGCCMKVVVGQRMYTQEGM